MRFTVSDYQRNSLPLSLGVDVSSQIEELEWPSKENEPVDL